MISNHHMGNASNQFQVRPMTRPEVDFAIDLAAREGWNPGLHDAGCFYQADPNGYFIGLLDELPVGCISAVSYAGQFGFIGLYIMLPDYRGRGYGIQLWRVAMARLAGQNIGLDGVVAQQTNYRKSGFNLAYRNIRFEGRVPATRCSSAGLTDAARVDFDRLCDYDRRCFPAERRPFLAGWLRMPGAHALAQVHRDEVRGYGVIRPCRHGWKIGPLFAETDTLARDLFQALCARAGADTVVYLDVPEVNPRALELANDHGMSKVFETARMYTGEFPTVEAERIYGVTTFELG